MAGLESLDSAELIAELERRGGTVERCTAPDAEGDHCGAIAVTTINGVRLCEPHRVEFNREHIRAKYMHDGGIEEFHRVQEQLVDRVLSLVAEGRSHEKVAEFVLATAQLTMDEFSYVEKRVRERRAMKVWLVWGQPKFCREERERLVLARSAPEAKKVWRDEAYKSGMKDIPNEVGAVEVAGVDEAMVIGEPEYGIGYKLRQG